MRLHNTADALTQLFNAAFMPAANDTDANESTSGRCYRMGVCEGNLDWLLWMRCIDRLFMLRGEREHCRASYEADLRRAESYVARDEGYQR